MDINSVERFGCSDVFDHVAVDDFKLVIIVPTLGAKSNKAIVADALSPQYPPAFQHPWPGQPGPYNWRVDLGNFRRITAARARIVAEAAGVNWMAQWKVIKVELDEAALFASFVR